MSRNYTINAKDKQGMHEKKVAFIQKAIPYLECWRSCLLLSANDFPLAEFYQYKNELNIKTRVLKRKLKGEF